MAEKELNIAELAAVVVAADPELRDEIKGLVSDIIGHMRYTMRHGDPNAKLQLARYITPQLLGAMKRVDKADNEAEKRAAYERMMAQLRGEDVPAA